MRPFRHDVFLVKSSKNNAFDEKFAYEWFHIQNMINVVWFHSKKHSKSKIEKEDCNPSVSN